MPYKEDTLLTLLATCNPFMDEKPKTNNDCVVIRRLSTKPFYTSSGKSDTLEKVRFELRCYGVTRPDAMNLADSVISLIEGSSDFMAKRLDEFSLVKKLDTQTHVAILSYLLW